jgi:hypothetical protein
MRLLLPIMISLLINACSQQVANNQRFKPLTDEEVKAKLAKAEAEANKQTPLPLPAKLYKVNIAKCDAQVPFTADSKCAKDLAARFVYVWGKPTEIGILYNQDRGQDYQNWANPEQSSQPIISRKISVNVDVFTKSEGCIQNLSTLKSGFYPIHSVGHLFTDNISRLPEEKVIYLGAVEQVPDDEAMKEFNNTRVASSKSGDSNDLNNPDPRYRKCRGAQKIDLKPQQIIPIASNTSNSQPQQIKYSLAW